MIVAKDFRLEDKGALVEVSCALTGDGFPDRLMFRLPAADAAAIDLAEPNWAAMALYWQALMMGQDLVIEADLSPLLLHNMRNDLMALMRNYEPLLKDIRIEAGFSTPVLPEGPRDVMTGFSGGVDSFSTFQLYSRPEVPPSLRMTALAVFQVGALGPTSTGEALLAPAVAHAKAHADDHGLRTYALSSNMDEVFAPAGRFGPIDFRRTVGLRNAAAALVLQNGVGTYLPSGSVSYASATYGPYSCTENMDAVFQPLLNTEKLRVQPAGAGLTRNDKLRVIVDNPEAQRRLNVCVSPAGKPRPTTTLNCSACWKCTQTLMVLETMGKLDAFSAVFDIWFYRANRRRLLQSLVDTAQQNNLTGIINQLIGLRDAGADFPIPRTSADLFLRKALRKAVLGGRKKPYLPASPPAKGSD